MASHSSGIKVSDEIKHAFGEANHDGSKRLFKIQIEDEAMQIKASVDTSAATYPDWRDGLDAIPDHLDATDACYILYRTDLSSEIGGYQWVLMCYVPDKAKVRQKMLYASTRAELKLALGGGSFVHEIFGTVPGDFDKKGFQQYIAMRDSAAPLTESEEAKELECAMSAAEAACLVGAGGASSTMVHGVAFQPQASAVDAVRELLDEGCPDTYLQLGIDEAKEEVMLREKVSGVTVENIAEKVPLDIPAFHLFRYDHEHEGKELHSIVFVYSCPDGSGKTKSAPVKSRMLYSSCKSAIEDMVPSASNGARSVDVKLEINDGIELTPEFIKNKVHPPPVVKKATFSKPKPAGKGPKRLVRK